MKYFNCQPTALVNKLLSQNTQDLKNSLNEIKEQKIELKMKEIVQIIRMKMTDSI